MALTTLNTLQGDAALSVTDGLTPEKPFYVSCETGCATPVYKPACDDIAASLAAREAQAILKYVTPEWLQTAFWRYDGSHTDFAAHLSEDENHHGVKTVDMRQRAGQPVLSGWPEPPRV